MENNIVIILIIINVIVSIIGFQNPQFFNKYKFDMNAVLNKKEYYRMITASFLHADYFHLFFNMLSLFFFKEIAQVYGIVGYLGIYFLSVIGGDIFTIIIHKRNLLYTSIGASGGVTGVIFSTIALFPNMQIAVYFIPMLGWIFAILYLAYSIYGMQNNVGNIGHTAHLGGAIVGLLGALVLKPMDAITAKANMFIMESPSLLVISIPIVFLFFVIFQERKN